MRKPYKFRGLAYADTSGHKFKQGKMVYGSLIATEKGDYAMIVPYKKDGEVTPTYIVDPETVALFVGTYYSDGREIYDDD